MNSRQDSKLTSASPTLFCLLLNHVFVGHAALSVSRRNHCLSNTFCNHCHILWVIGLYCWARWLACWLVIGRIDDHVHGWLDGCIGGWLGEYINSRLDGFIDGCLDNSVNAWLERQPDGSLERWLDSRVSGWIDDCNGWRYCRRCCRLCHTILPSSSCFELTLSFFLFVWCQQNNTDKHWWQQQQQTTPSMVTATIVIIVVHVVVMVVGGGWDNISSS